MEVNSHTLTWSTLDAANLTPTMFARFGNDRLSPAQIEAQVALATAFTRCFPDARADFYCNRERAADFVLSQFYEGGAIPLDPEMARLCAHLGPLFAEVIQIDIARVELTGASSEARVAALIVSVVAEPVARFTWVALSRPRTGLEHNGDGFWVSSGNETFVACVIDGLGHGQEAQRARDRVLDELPNCRNFGLEQLFANAHQVLQASRGAAMTAVCLDERRGTLSHAGVGNVELRLTPNASTFFAIPGILGMSPRTSVQVRDCLWSEDALLVLHSDGIRSGWSLTALARSNLPPLFLALILFHDCANPEDDATILVVRGGHHA